MVKDIKPRATPPALRLCKTRRRKRAPFVEDKPIVADDQEIDSFSTGERLDLNRYFIKNPARTWFVQVTGDSMTGAGIHPKDILIVERGGSPSHGDIIVARVDDELLVKRLCVRGEQIQLLPENPEYEPIDITPEMDFKVFGKVLHVIHSFYQEAD
jgi:DNA polymerase V